MPGTLQDTWCFLARYFCPLWAKWPIPHPFLPEIHIVHICKVPQLYPQIWGLKFFSLEDPFKIWISFRHFFHQQRLCILAPKSPALSNANCHLFTRHFFCKCFILKQFLQSGNGGEELYKLLYIFHLFCAIWEEKWGRVPPTGNVLPMGCGEKFLKEGWFTNIFFI